LVLRPWMRPPTAIAGQRPCCHCALVGCRLSRMSSPWGIPTECRFGLAGQGQCLVGPGRMSNCRKSLRKANGIASNVLCRRKVVLCLLGGLEHKLKSMALMGPVEHLNNAVVWEATTKPREEGGVKAIHEPLADANWKRSMA
jgi:hypothetical protein